MSTQPPCSEIPADDGRVMEGEVSRAPESERGGDWPPEDPRSPNESTDGLGRWLEPLLTLVAVGVAAGLLFWFTVIPYPRGLQSGDPGASALMEQRMEEARSVGDTLEVLRQWVPLAEISPNLQRAVVVAEDYRFREHEGIDWVSLAEEVDWKGDDDFSWLSPSDLGALVDALQYVWENRSGLRGRSTLTQQLAKNLYFGTDRRLIRKAMEAVVAKRLERQLEKDRILELYLNIAEWGPGVFGAEAAAQAYFGRSAAKLSLSQAATLAATLPHPLTSNLHTRPSRMLWRKDLILDRIDPSRRVPVIPSPLPPPDFGVDFGPSRQPVTVPPPATPATDDSAGAGVDSLTVDPINDLLPADSAVRPDTVSTPGVFGWDEPDPHTL